MNDLLVTNGKGDMLLSACCKDCMRLTAIEITSPNCPFPISMPDNPMYGLECCACGEITKPLAEAE